MIGAELLLHTLDRLESGEPLQWAEQDDAQATYAEKLEAQDRVLDPTRPVRELERVVRALHPHIGARAMLPGRRAPGRPCERRLRIRRCPRAARSARSGWWSTMGGCC